MRRESVSNPTSCGLYEARADYDDRSIVVYQAYNEAIASAAVRAQRFVPPFSLNRMTWIKPSFLWMMERSNWGRKKDQECILAVRMTRAGWDEALSLAVLTHPSARVYPDTSDWEEDSKGAAVRVQWDPDRGLRGENLERRAIQVGLGRAIVQRYVEEWTLEIADITPKVRKMRDLLREGKVKEAERLLPREKPYRVSAETARRLGME
jgi:hypothetical protein